MNPFVQQVLGVVARGAVIWIGAKIGNTVTQDDAAQIVVQYVLPAAMLLWSVYQKYANRQKLVTALATPAKMREQQLEGPIKDGKAAAVTTQKHEIPS